MRAGGQLADADTTAPDMLVDLDLELNAADIHLALLS